MSFKSFEPNSLSWPILSVLLKLPDATSLIQLFFQSLSEFKNYRFGHDNFILLFVGGPTAISEEPFYSSLQNAVTYSLETCLLIGRTTRHLCNVHSCQHDNRKFYGLDIVMNTMTVDTWRIRENNFMCVLMDSICAVVSSSTD